jgi:hypothetical protein
MPNSRTVFLQVGLNDIPAWNCCSPGASHRRSPLAWWTSGTGQAPSRSSTGTEQVKYRHYHRTLIAQKLLT